MDPVDNFKIMILAWNTGAYFKLKPFNTDLVDYVECDIYINYFNNVKKVYALEQPPISLINARDIVSTLCACRAIYQWLTFG